MTIILWIYAKTILWIPSPGALLSTNLIVLTQDQKRLRTSKFQGRRERRVLGSRGEKFCEAKTSRELRSRKDIIFNHRC
ncbi:hypothetical protein L596_012292 [Steinernema carpocapsae]|uniref:Uncharacterized protein n=1 Tax=Steinernema carpocapsae TaxID=34508 RepID=A0A4U5NWQ4_STECR|nr:hypothetical protein L596_012292 [Steinernema carpocapsae]